MPEMAPFLIRGLSKSYAGVQALSNVSFNIREGEVHALCGENGAGKSTLNKILSGSVRPDAGEVVVDGEPLELGSVSSAERHGIAIVHQESTAFGHLNAIDNIHLLHEPARLGGLWLDRSAMREAAQGVLARLGEEVDLDRPLDVLSPAQRQMVAIARALLRKCRLLILDEPTASLSAKETEALFRAIRTLRGEGVAVLYVSHRLDEVFALADRVTVLRDGHYAGTRETSDLTTTELVRLMVGRELEATNLRKAVELGEVALDVRGLTRKGVFEDVSLQVHRGEVVVLAGLIGAGRSEVARAIFGVEAYELGSVHVASPTGGLTTWERGVPRASVRKGLAYVTEDRQHEGLHLPLSIRHNLTMARLPELANAGIVRASEEKRLARESIQSLAIKTPRDTLPIESLSGGNQQKALLGKWLATEPRVFILDEPTRGVDVGAKAEVHELIRKLASDGAAVLVISSELPEVLALADRVLVMRQGRIAGELNREDATQEKILELALPQSGEGAGRTSPRARRLSRELGVAGLLALLVLVVTIVNPGFMALENLRDMVVKVAPAVIVASGLTFVILAREIDISVGSVMGLCSASLGIACSADRMSLPPWVGVLLCLGVGLSAGVLNGLLVAWARIPSIIVTLGMLTLWSGVTELLLAGKWITQMPVSLREFGTGSAAGVPYIVMVALAVALLCGWLAGRTPFGRRVYALGSNPQAARQIGLPVQRSQIAVFALTGLFVGVAALFSATQLQVIEAGFGKGFELAVVAAVVVGGVSIRGGSGSVLGAVLGATLLGVIGTMLIFLRLGDSSVYWERAIQGALILLAVLGDHLSRRKGIVP